MFSTTCKIVAVNPNRANTYLDKKIRLSNHLGNESYRAILEPIAFELATQRETYPMTIISLKLKYCGYAYTLFEKRLKENQFVGESKEPTARLFAQFHSPQTERMKKELIQKIKKYDSRVRVLFATSALGMGVDTPYVTNIIHISPPGTIEAYIQEIGRAGRMVGIQAKAVLYYNKIRTHRRIIARVVTDRTLFIPLYL
ncbi:putative ATP-dependent DNA helicase Q1 [Montipora foliosa]|uniref:putative ATP-dependent DNA helicase Q1 n=1 Tax=Montipora foliosa TaxID=591990 RepID=UPI0035F1144C